MDKTTPGRISECQQRRHVSALRDSTRDDKLVDHLFARELQLVDEPPRAGMEPEQGSRVLFEHDPHPVPTCDVMELVTGDGALAFVTQFAESLRQQDDRVAGCQT